MPTGTTTLGKVTNPGTGSPNLLLNTLAFTTPEPELVTGTQTLDDSAAAGGDGDGVLEPGESFRLTQGIRNVGRAAATAVGSTLTESLPTLALTQATSAYPNLAIGATQANPTPFAGTLSAAADCGASLPMTLQMTTAQGPFSVPVVLSTGVTATPVPFTVNPALAIPDNNAAGASSNLTVSGVSGALRDINVRLNVTHPFDEDLVFTLTGPSGTTITLINHRGGSGDNFTATILDDEAATPVGSGVAPFAGAFRPEQPLSAFNGAPANGTWTLRVVDTAATDVGTLNSWGMDAAGATCSFGGPPQTTIVSGPPDPTNDDTPTFTFSADQAGSTFECSIDAAAFTTCTSPRTTATLADGSHTFAVRARNSAGTADPTPASQTFTVDTVVAVTPPPPPPVGPPPPPPVGPPPPPPVAPPPPPPVAPPVIRSGADQFTITTGPRRSIRRGVRVTLQCPAQCSFRLALVIEAPTARRYGLGSRSVTIGSARATLASAGRHLTVTLSAKAKRRLRGARSLRAKLKAGHTDASGRTTTKSLVISLTR